MQHNEINKATYMERQYTFRWCATLAASSRDFMAIARNTVSSVKLPRMTIEQKKITAIQPLCSMPPYDRIPSYMISFQFSPVST